MERTALIVDPPNGGLQPMTPEAEARPATPKARRLQKTRRGRGAVNGPEHEERASEATTRGAR